MPLEYSFFLWRREMGVGYFEMCVTPPSIILRDLEYIHLQKKYGEKQAEK